MQTISRSVYSTIRTEGGILPADLLQRIALLGGHGDQALEGLTPADYGLYSGERLNEAINRSWSRCLAAWERFASRMESLPAAATGTTETRELWLLVLLDELGYGRPESAAAEVINGESYPISHRWQGVPIHLVTYKQELDHQPQVATTVRRIPHSLMQEYLNRSPDHLWGIISNGLQLRLLRDNVSLTRAAYCQFDLESMMRGEQYADFALMWMVCHATRLEGEPCILEQWSQKAAETGTRALESLRSGVHEAIQHLGSGFVARRNDVPLNASLTQALKEGALDRQEYYRQLLRMAYRLIFMLVAEDRNLLHATDSDKDAQQRYARFYSVGRLRELCIKQRGTAHTDLYAGLSQTFRLLQDGYAPLAIPALGGLLFDAQAAQDLDGARLPNKSLLDALRALCYTRSDGVLRRVDYANLGSEELGSVYESLLELRPRMDVDAGTFALEFVAGSERKTTGSYYTPSSLIQSLLDTALDPVIANRLALAGDDATAREKALLGIRVVDPACGSGHFLVGAAHRLAHRLARERSGGQEPTPSARRQALRDVVRECIHGVDINPMSVELCKVALWMETLDPGKPLGFLDANIQCGNSLIGTTPALLSCGLPDEAFSPITGDDKKYCNNWRKANKTQRTEGRAGQLSMLDTAGRPWEHLGNLAASMIDLDTLPDDSTEAVRHKQEIYTRAVHSEAYVNNRLLADAWCAGFVWQKTDRWDYPITDGLLRELEHNPHSVAPAWRKEIQQLAEQYKFFHWHLAFPQVFQPLPTHEMDDDDPCGWRGGFDVVLGNPPWERVKLQEKEFFAGLSDEVSEAANAAARRKLIKTLEKDDSNLWQAYRDALRSAEASSQFLRTSGRYPLTGVGDINTYQVFAGLGRQLMHERGRAGIIVPSGIATDMTNAPFFADLVNSQQLANLYDFENRQAIFPGVHRSYKFCLLTLRGAADSDGGTAEFAFFLQNVDELQDEQRCFVLTSADFALLNPNTRTCPIFRTRHDAELTRQLYRAAPVLIDDRQHQNPWGVSFSTMFHMSNNSALFRTREELEEQDLQLQGNRYAGPGGQPLYLPLYEAKMMHQYDHRFGSYAGLAERSGQLQHPTPARYADAAHLPLPWYWVKAEEVDAKAPPEQGWFLGFRDITNSTNERTAIFTVVPRSAVGHKLPLLLTTQPSMVPALIAGINTICFDYVVRQKLGGTDLTFFIVKQLPVLPPQRYTLALQAYIAPRVLELTYTAWDLTAYADDVWRGADTSLQAALEAQWQANHDATGSQAATPPDWLALDGAGPWPRPDGFAHPPFQWDEERRFALRCQLDALYFHLYGVSRDDAAYIMDTFPIVKKHDEAAYGEFRTQRVVLEEYDALLRGPLAGELGG